jgi:MoaA/NifB/PqqE/SkfB family radical SAM enzyme
MIRKLLEKKTRYSRHALSLFRYSSPNKLMNLARVEWERSRGRVNVTGLPYVTVLDPTNVCNLKCPICPTTKGELPQPSGRIALEDYKRFVDRIAPHTYRLILYNWGEPFLHRQIVEMLDYAHRNRISTQISSNLNILPREGAEALVSSGLDDLVVSCDGLTQKTYERYRVLGDLSKLTTNMNLIRDAKRKLKSSSPNIELQFLVFRHNEHEVPRVEEFARSHGADVVRIVKPAIDMKLKDIRPADNPEYVRPEHQVLPIQEPAPLSEPVPAKPETLSAIDCYWPWRVLTSSWNGDIDPCCYHNTLGSFGNIFDAPLIEVFNNEKFRYARRRIVGKAAPDGFDDVICKTCKGYTV